MINRRSIPSFRKLLKIKVELERKIFAEWLRVGSVEDKIRVDRLRWFGTLANVAALGFLSCGDKILYYVSYKKKLYAKNEL